MRHIFVAVLFILIAPATLAAESALDSLRINVSGSSRPFIYTNKETAYYYGETLGPARDSWEGLTVYGHKFLDDYDLLVDGKALDRRSARVAVYPDYLRRIYPGGLIEDVRLLDSIPLLCISLEIPGRPRSVEFIPWRSDGHDSSDFRCEDSSGVLTVANAHHLRRLSTENYPVWLACRALGPASMGTSLAERGRFSPSSLRIDSSNHPMILVGVGDDLREARALVARSRSSIIQLVQARRSRMERLLSASLVNTDDARFDKALAWAKLSLDALMMNQGSHGIFAGLPWFNDYWGRDTFISLPGATLVTGRFAEARQILLSFASFQNTDTASTDYGRIPNLVTTTEKAYNTADGTPRFVIAAREYVERSGDSSFIATMYPVVQRATDGTIRYHTDSLGFLVHGDAETWMDAVGPNGPWSPRGNRANDVQALWADQLSAAAWFAHMTGHHDAATRWAELRQRCVRNFERLFVRHAEGFVVDHLRADGSSDRELRPNQIFCGDLLDEATRARVLRVVTTRLTYEYGVASLSQDDDNFHPYHRYEPYYPKDAAYHNGTVWTWLQGPLISELCRADRARTAFRLTRNAIHQILDRGCVGTQSELLDAIPRPGEQEPRLSGTVSQAWNLAEFIRNFYDDYLGVQVDEFSKTLSLHPHLPASVATVHARIPLRRGMLSVALDARPGAKTIAIDARGVPDTLAATVDLPSANDGFTRTVFLLPPGKTVSLNYASSGVRVSAGKGRISASTWELKSTVPDSLLGPLPFAPPVIRPNLRALRGPGYPLLSNASIKTTNPHAVVLFDTLDPARDDSGEGHYTYPRNPSFVPGSFDLLRFSVSVDTANAYFVLKFRSLSDPGWHPEYGYQLTFVAIALDQDNEPGSGRRDVPANAHYMLPPGYGYERLILVGGGIQIQDAAGNTLAAYVPIDSDAAHPLGDRATATIAFAVPLQFLGVPKDNWRYTVLVGGQDDHGGAGIGEFRNVEHDTGDWHGGGKEHPSDSNVYDILQVKLR